jgi:hypothetical protein
MRYLKDLLLTDTFMIKGHINTGDQRLSTFLNSIPRSYLEMEDVTFIGHVQGQRVTTPRMLVRIDEILLAHEMEVAGDEYLRLLAGKERAEITVVAQFGGAMPLRISGRVCKRAVERDADNPHDFIVMVEPMIQGFMAREPEDFAVLAALPYVIINRNRIALILQ